jgi:hypothetical protein
VKRTRHLLAFAGLIVCLVVLGGCGQPVTTSRGPTPDQAPPFRHYVAAVLTEASQQALLERMEQLAPIPEGWTRVAHHMTIAPPSNDAWRLLSEDYPIAKGGKVEVTVLGYARDDKGMAVEVASQPSYEALRGSNEHPHITVALAPGTSAVHSNELLARQAYKKIEPPLKLEARLCIVSADSSTTIPELPGLARNLKKPAEAGSK